MMNKWVVGCIAFVVIVGAAACTTFFIMLGNGYDRHGASYGALLYGGMVGIPVWLVVLGVFLKGANAFAAGKLSGRINEIAETRRSGKTS